jgi:transglutaminase-like putative cysteine protease
VSRLTRQLAPALVCAAALGSSASSLVLGAALAAAVTALAAVGARLELDRGRQLLTSAIGAGAGYVTAALTYESLGGTLPDGWARFASAALLAGGARFLLVMPRGEHRPTLALVFVALLAAGKTQSATYPAWVVAFLLSSTWAFGAERRSPPGAGRVALGALVVVLAASLGAGATIGLRRLHAWLKNRVHSSAYVWRPQVGFAARMDLGSLDGLMDSEQIVLRVHGERVDYLRGTSLDVYEWGRWLRSDPAEQEEKASFGKAGTGSASVTIEALSERSGRFFLPLEARDLVTEPEAVVVDTMGTVVRAAKGAAPRSSFSLGPRDRAVLAAPRTPDVQLPRSLWQMIQPLVLDWTRGARGVEQQLEAIERHLGAEYRYSRSFERDERIDPVLDFLFIDKQGHCEYFAAALALCARSIGIPARVVMGYRVAERSPFGYHVVREKNAHAWVEAWIPGRGWVTRDATPAEAMPQNVEHEAGYVASSLDALAVGYDELTTWLEQRSVRETSIAWLVGLVILSLIVLRGVQRRRSARRRPATDEAPLECLDRLLESLERRGHQRRPDEPLERLAARIPDAEAARLLERYSALRYGGHGNEQGLARDVAEYARERPPSP